VNVVEAFVSGGILGVANAAHCASMCGPFAWRAGEPPRRAFGFSAYAVGKTFTYVVLGAFAGAFGAEVFGGTSEGLAIFAGVVACALIVAGVARLRPPKPASPGVGRAFEFATRPLRALLRSEPPGGRFTLGAASGLLPCGPVYLAAFAGAATGAPLRSAVLMFGFGLGTIPALAAVAWLGAGLRARLGRDGARLAGGVALVLGGLVAAARAYATFDAGRAACCR
jgi:uncharacterized protein